MVGYVGIYCRISEAKDRPRRNGNGARGKGVTNQEEWGREYAARKWPGLPVRVYVDDDLSAAKRNVWLPDRERLREDMAAGEIAHVWAVEQSRLQRTELDWFVLADEFEDAGIDELDTNRDGVVPVRDIKASFQAVINADEVRKLRKRVSDDMAKHASKGGIPGGTVYGYRRLTVDGVKRLEVIPEQAEIVRETAARVLAGESQTSIAKDLHGRGVKGVNGGRVWQSTVHSMVTNHVVAGKRLHDPGAKGSGSVYQGAWEPILDEDTWLAVRAKLGVTKVGIRKNTRPTRYRYETLLNGVISCEDCPKGGSEYYMVAANRKERRASGSIRRLAYMCRLCGRAMDADAIDTHVERQLLAKLDELVDLRNPNGDSEDRREAILAELASFEDKRARWGVQLADDDMDPVTYAAARERLAERERELLAELAEIPTNGNALDAGAIRHAWTSNTINERREIVRMLIDRVTIAPYRGGLKYPVDLNRITIHGPGWN